MTDEELLKKCKLAIRKFSVDPLDEEVSDLIEACKLDLKTSGVVNINMDDALVLRAIELYIKGNFGFLDDAKAKRIDRAYKSLVIHMSLCEEYNTLPEQEGEENV